MKNQYGEKISLAIKALLSRCLKRRGLFFIGCSIGVMCACFIWILFSCYRVFVPYCPERMDLSISVPPNAEGMPKMLLISLRVPEGQHLASTEACHAGLCHLDVICLFDDLNKLSFESPILVCVQENPNVLLYQVQLHALGFNADDSELLKHHITKVELEGKLPFLFSDAAAGLEGKIGAVSLKNCAYYSPDLND